MKKNLVLSIIGVLLSIVGFSQPGLQNIRWTAKTNGNGELDVYAKNVSGTDISGVLNANTLALCAIIKSSITQPTSVTVTSTIPGLTSFTAFPAETSTQNAVAYNVYTFAPSSSATSSSAVDFPSNTEVLIASYIISGGSATSADLQLADLANGGPSTSDFCYIFPIPSAGGGGDQDDYSNPFYSDIASDANLLNANGTNDLSSMGFSTFIATSTPVPVQFTGFSASKKDDNAVLNWAVANEGIITDHYVVERSLDGSTFSDIATVAVKGNSSVNTYTYSDENISNLNTSVIYYRIEEVDKNGLTVATGIRAVSVAAGAEIKAYPNPTKGNVTVTISLQAAADLALSLVDGNGKTVQQLQVAGAKGINTQPLDLSNYAAGTYLLKVNNGTDITTLPIVKQ